jgi:hypothetical protein
MTALSAASCGALPELPAFPGASPQVPQIHVAGLYSKRPFAGTTERLTMLLEQAIDALPEPQRRAIDPRLVWSGVPASTTAAPGHPAVPGEAQALDALLTSSATTAGRVPDLVALSSSEVLQYAVQHRLLRPIDDLVQTTSLVHQEDYFPGVLVASRVSGKLYGLPLSMTPGMLQYDPQLFHAAGLRPPDGTWDWRRLVEACAKLTKPPRQYAFAPFSVPSVLVFLWQNGADVLSQDGRRCTLVDTAAAEAAAFYGDLFTRYKVVAPTPTTALASSFFGPTQSVYNGAQIAMQFVEFLSTPSPPSCERTLRYAQLFRGVAQATTLQLNGLLAKTSRAADQPADFTALVALATELQRRSYLPPRRSLTKQADPAKAALTLEPAEATAVMQAAAYARASPLDAAMSSAIATKLETPLRTGSATASEACQAAAAAINAFLAVRTAG